jgi:hypothetical protein
MVAGHEARGACGKRTLKARDYLATATGSAGVALGTPSRAEPLWGPVSSSGSITIYVDPWNEVNRASSLQKPLKGSRFIYKHSSTNLCFLLLSSAFVLDQQQCPQTPIPRLSSASMTASRGASAKKRSRFHAPVSARSWLNFRMWPRIQRTVCSKPARSSDPANLTLYASAIL